MKITFNQKKGEITYTSENHTEAFRLGQISEKVSCKISIQASGETVELVLMADNIYRFLVSK